MVTTTSTFKRQEDGMTTLERQISGFLRPMADRIYEAIMRRTLWAIERVA